MKTKGKEWVKYYKQSFSYLKNRILATILPVEELLVAYYIKGLLTQIAMWVKRAHGETLEEDFCEAIQVEKDMFYLKENPNTSSEQACTSRKNVSDVFLDIRFLEIHHLTCSILDIRLLIFN